MHRLAHRRQRHDLVDPGSTDPGPVRKGREGLRIVDVDGEDVGTVAQVQMGDSHAVTGQAQQGSRGMSALVAAFTAGPTIPERERMVRLGYLRIGGGLLSSDRYVTADHVVGVDGDRVQLDVRGSALLEA